MKITKSRLVELITEEAEKMTVSEEEVIDEGIFDFLVGSLTKYLVKTARKPVFIGQ